MTDRARILIGDVRAKLAELPDESVQCVVTSPPYWGLRDYGTGTWEGGDPECPHRRSNMRQDHTAKGFTGTRGRQKYAAASAQPMLNVCSACGAVRIDSQIGLEATPAEYVDHLVDVFREVRRVLRSDGTCWVNIGDTYVGGRSGGIGPKSTITSHRNHNAARAALKAAGGAKHRTAPGLKPKDMVGIPWRVALAMQDDGWWLRSDIIWHKPSPMPECVRDRPSRAHEYLFLFAKSERYFFDADAIRTPLREKTWTSYGSKRRSKGTDALGRVAAHNFSRDMPERAPAVDEKGRPLGANIRTVWRLDEIDAPDVWTIAQEPYPHSHFATFPRKLVEPCIRAGCPRGGAIVLDPFAGSGTTGEVALGLGHSAILIELNPDYLPLIERRLSGVQYPLLTAESAE